MVTRSGLPQNYVTVEPTIYADMENIADWTLTSGGAISADTVNFRTGTQSMRIGALTNCRITTVAWNLTNNKVMRIWIYKHAPSTHAIYVYLYQSSAYLQTTVSLSALKIGWTQIAVRPESWSVGSGSPSWGSTFTRIQIVASDADVDISIDSISFGQESIPSVLFGFDDTVASTYTVAYPILAAAGILGTSWCVSSLVGGGNQCSLAQLQEMYAAGWAVGNHTSDHTPLVGLSQSAAEEKIKTCADYLIANGMPRAAHHFCYPGGSVDAAGIAACTAQGVLTARTTTALTQEHPPDTLLMVSCGFIGATTTLAQAMTIVDNAIKTGGSVHFMFHKLVASNPTSTDWLTSDFQLLVNYVVAKRVRCLTIDEWYVGLTNPRYRSLPLTRA